MSNFQYTFSVKIEKWKKLQSSSPSSLRSVLSRIQWIPWSDHVKYLFLALQHFKQFKHIYNTQKIYKDKSQSFVRNKLKQCELKQFFLEIANWISYDKHSSVNSQFALYPLDTGYKLNVRKTYKRPLWRLLYVLSTFNLRPVTRR